MYYLTLDGHRPKRQHIFRQSHTGGYCLSLIPCLAERHVKVWENTGSYFGTVYQNIEQISGYTSEKVRNMVIDELLKSVIP